MNTRTLIIIWVDIVLSIALIIGIYIYTSRTSVDPPPACDHPTLTLTGTFSIHEDKYPIPVFVTNTDTYWIYGSIEDTQTYGSRVQTITAKLSPSYRENQQCNICFQTCPVCQCPMDRPLLYDIEILPVQKSGR